MHKLNPLTMPLNGVKLIEASAGTGKTYTIATLYLRLLIEKGLSVREILVVTYTNAATEELRDRIRDKLRHAIHLLNLGEAAISAEDDPVLVEILRSIDESPPTMIQHLITELTCIDEAAIHTIHGFAQRMLLDNAFESGSLFETEFLQSENDLLDEVVSDFWRQHFYTASNGLASQIHRRWTAPVYLKQEIRGYLNKPYNRLLPQLTADDYSEAHYEKLYQQARDIWAANEATLCESISEAAGNKTLSAAKDNYHPEKLASAIEQMALFFAKVPPVYALPYGFELFSQSHLDNSLLKAAAKKGLTAPQHEFFDLCEGLQQLVDKLLIGILQQAISWCHAEMGKRKEAAALLSYNDLLTQLRDALISEQGEALATHIATRYPYAMIDEFQDTDPEQFQIFDRIYGNHPHVPDACGFYMIGDPKQAIYSFRGADIFTYMLAKDATAAEAQYTLDTNWRSSSRLIEAVNSLYQQSTAPFVYAGHIDHHRVEASSKADEQALLIEGKHPTPLQCWFVHRNEERVSGKDPSKGRLTKTQSQPEIAQACASECARLLGLAKKQQAMIGDDPLQPQDIAILVRDRYEADEIRHALRQKGIASAYYSRDSVFNAAEAGQLMMLLHSIAEPGDESLLRAALSSSLIALSAEKLDALLQDDMQWEQRLSQIQAFHRQWQERGFMAMFRRLLHEFEIPHRLLSLNDGERRLTNLMQLGELMQSASREHEGIENQLRWLHEQMDNPDGNMEEQRLRLESDEALVKVVNIHTSKGLEYPVVFLPFIYSCKPTKSGQPLYVHDEQDPSSVILNLAPDDATYELAEKERLAEDLRLLYVALTRAKYLCYFSYGYFKDLERSALAWLLHGSDAQQPLYDLAAQLHKADDETLLAALRERVQQSSNTIATTELPAYQPPLQREMPAHDTLKARTATRHIDWHWRMTSYSGLTASHSAPSATAEFQETGSRNEDAQRREEDEQEAGLNLFRFPKGARAGTFMHTILEQLDFANVTKETVSEEVARQLQRFGFDEMWQGVIEQMCHHTLDTALNDAGLKLRQLGMQQKLVEMEFQYPIQKLKAESLNRIVEGLGDPARDEQSNDEHGHKLEFHPVSGIMRGFIDLTFEHNGRFYIADYKSNWLGFHIEDYTRERLAQVIEEHRYDLQYLIYTLALHRYLKANLADYDYETHFGGVYYLFLRGLSPEHGFNKGVFYDRPELSLIETLDAMMWGEE